jgi:hypothetical protein
MRNTLTKRKTESIMRRHFPSTSMASSKLGGEGVVDEYNVVTRLPALFGVSGGDVHASAP